MSPVYFVTQVLGTLRGSAPIARRKGFPQASALVTPAGKEHPPGTPPALVQPSAALRPFHSRFASFQGWAIPLPIAPCYPRLRQEAFGM